MNGRFCLRLGRWLCRWLLVLHVGYFVVRGVYRRVWCCWQDGRNNGRQLLNFHGVGGGVEGTICSIIVGNGVYGLWLCVE